jgi:hypothetical protein
MTEDSSPVRFDHTLEQTIRGRHSARNDEVGEPFSYFGRDDDTAGVRVVSQR